jgi:hypothetical protein
MTADAAPSSVSASAPVSPWLFWGGALVVAAGTLAYLVLGLGLTPDAPTIAMASAVVVLMVALRSLFRVVFALGFESAELWADAAASSGGAASERRAEYKRVLRAIKQLDEDHEVGKLADADHKSLRDGLTLRAVELKRELADVAKSDELHPKLQAALAGESEAPACPKCETVNDPDARFCKSCGHNFESAEAQAEVPEGADVQEATA